MPRMIAAGKVTVTVGPEKKFSPKLSKRAMLNLMQGLTARGTPRVTRWRSRSGLSDKLLGHTEYMRQWRAMKGAR